MVKPNPHYAVIHAGPKATELKKLVEQLDKVGAPEFYFMSDLVLALKVENEFKIELNDLLYDMTEGEYYRHCLNAGNVEANNLMFDIAEHAKSVAEYLHTTLLNGGRYDADGKFPYEFHSFDGRVIYLRSL